MSAVMERTDDLIDHAAMAVHQNLLNTLSERVSVANQLLRKETAAFDAANVAYQNAIFTRGGDAHQCKLALEAAARRFAVESERSAAARAELQDANALTDTVRAIAHKPVHESHMRNWRDDVKRRDAAVAVLAGIDADIAADIAGMRACNAIGLQDIHGLLQSHELPKTARDLRAHFEARYIEWENPKHPAQMPKEQLTDEEAREQGLVRVSRGAATQFVHPSAVASHVAIGWKEI